MTKEKWYQKFPLFSSIEKAMKEKPKQVPRGIAFSDTQSRGSLSKAYVPDFLIKPPFGWPRYKDLDAIRRLARTPQAAIATKTVIDELIAVPWDIVPKEGFSEDNPVTKARMQEVKQFFENPNTNSESFNNIRRKYWRDRLEVNSGILVKEFNQSGQMVELMAADGITFLKNPNIHGKFTEREELMIDKEIEMQVDQAEGNRATSSSQAFLGLAQERDGTLSMLDAAEKAAYFQFGWHVSARPVPFGKREIVWMEENPYTGDIYGIGLMEYMLDLLQTLIYQIEYNLEYFEDNNIPKGFISLPGSEDEEVKEFAEKWNTFQLKQNRTGQIRKAHHRVPITNSAEKAEFVRIQFSSAELELIASSTLFQKLVWAMFGVTPTEAGFTEESNRATGTEQKQTFRRKAILPRLVDEEFYINKQVLSEFGYEDVEFKFNTFDTDEERAKADLYEVMLRSKWRTINEIRQEEGLEDIEGGDEIMGVNKEPPQMSLFGEGAQNALNQGQNKPKEGTMTREEENAREGQRKEDRKQTQGKALAAEATQGNITLDENEVIGLMKDMLKRKEKEILDFLSKETRKERLSQIRIKGIDEAEERAGDLFDFNNLKSQVDKMVEDLYKKGFSSAEKQLDMNLTMNKAQIAFLAKHTFNNIKGANLDIKNKLRQELQRAMIAGEGIGKITERVKSVFDVAEHRATMIARTEANRAEVQGSLQAMKQSGRNVQKEWLATLDNDTCKTCKRLHGTRIGINEVFKGASGDLDAAPAHPQCRCDLLYFFQGKNTKSKTIDEYAKRWKKESA